jgi:hypothetical protein
MPVQKKVLENRCPLKSRSDHGHRRPATLSVPGVRHITHQIERNGYKALPHILPGEYFFMCKDCCAVWMAASPYSVVSEEGVLGFYNRELMWVPYPGVT